MIEIAACIVGVLIVIAVVWWNDRQKWAAYWRHVRSTAADRRGNAQGGEGMRAEETYQNAWARLGNDCFIDYGKFPTSLMAKARLKEVIAADRAAVPCGRWVRCSPRLDIWRMRAVQAAALGLPIPLFPTGEELWPRYRWSERR